MSVSPVTQPLPPSRLLLGLVILLTGLGEMSTQIYAPALPALAAGFGVGTVAVQATLSAFIIAFGCGQLIYGPLSDRFGR
ncbi:Bcr/CflA family drug resistance efflux transporter, partial [Acinetobacter baumannii]